MPNFISDIFPSSKTKLAVPSDYWDEKSKEGKPTKKMA